jgi:prevent-host-death family protein
MENLKHFNRNAQTNERTTIWCSTAGTDAAIVVARIVEVKADRPDLPEQNSLSRYCKPRLDGRMWPSVMRAGPKNTGFRQETRTRRAKRVVTELAYRIEYSMKVIEEADATATLAEYAAEIGSDPLIVTSEGRPVAALVPIENTDLETASLSTNRQFIDLIERSRASVRAGGGILGEEMRRRFG